MPEKPVSDREWVGLEVPDDKRLQMVATMMGLRKDEALSVLIRAAVVAYAEKEDPKRLQQILDSVQQPYPMKGLLEGVTGMQEFDSPDVKEVKAMTKEPTPPTQTAEKDSRMQDFEAKEKAARAAVSGKKTA
jgi:hypothetical protein